MTNAIVFLPNPPEVPFRLNERGRK
jgi:hypothetical protein